MIQFNLLPDVKLQFIKAERTKRVVTGVSVIAGAAALVVLLLLLFTVDVVQKKSINDLTHDIKTNADTLKHTPDLQKMLTVQSQLHSLTSLHDQDPVSSRLFDFMSRLTPKQASISDLSIDNTANTMTVTGKAPTLDVVNTFVDSLKYTNYTTSADTSDGSSKPAFTNVVLSSFGRDSKTASYTITLNFDPALFSNASDVTLTANGQAITQQTNITFTKDTDE